MSSTNVISFDLWLHDEPLHAYHTPPDIHPSTYTPMLPPWMGDFTPYTYAHTAARNNWTIDVTHSNLL